MNTLEDILAERQARQGAGDSRAFTERETDRLIEAITGVLAHATVSRNNAVQKTEITNHVGTQEVSGEVSVSELEAVMALLEELKEEVRESKAQFPDVQKVSGSVTVENQVTIPEVRFPEYPKRMDAAVTQLPKYVGEKLDEIRAAIRSIDVRPEVSLETKASDVHVDLSSVVSGLEDVTAMLVLLNGKEQAETDLAPLLDGLSSVKESVQNLKFPVPNFQSSWQHSIDMQSKDVPATYVYVTVGGVKAVSYIQITAKDGGTYRKTFSYTLGDGNNPDASTGWVRQ